MLELCVSRSNKFYVFAEKVSRKLSLLLSILSPFKQPINIQLRNTLSQNIKVFCIFVIPGRHRSRRAASEE